MFLLNEKEKLLFILIFVNKKPSDKTQRTREKYLILAQHKMYELLVLFRLFFILVQLP